MYWHFPTPFDLLDHTADVRIRVCGSNPQETLAHLVLAYTSLVTGGVAPIDQTETMIEIPMQDDLALVAVNCVRSVHQLFCLRKLLVCEVEFLEFPMIAGRVEPTVLRMHVGLGAYDSKAHKDGLEIKAVTYHQAHFEQNDHGYVATMVFDV